MVWKRMAAIAECLAVVMAFRLGAAEPRAQSANEAATALPLHSLVVHGKRTEDPVLQPLAPVESHELTTTAVGRIELEATRPRSAIDALDFTPSFQKILHGRKNEFSLTLRGMSNVNVLVDGLQLGTKEDSRFVNHLPPGFIEEIRVIRDSTCLIYGPPQLSGSGGVMGFGGVIDLRLREPGKVQEGSLRTEIGRYAENLQELTLSGPITSRLGYVLGASRNVYGGPGGDHMEDNYSHLMGRLVLHYQEDSTLSLSVLREDGDRELQKAEKGTVFYGYREEYDPLETTIGILSLHHVWNESVSTTLEGYYRDYDATYHRYDTHTEKDLEEHKEGIVLRQALRFPDRNVLRFGGGISHWDNPTGKLYYMGMERREDAYSLYLQDEWRILPDLLTVDAGLRWDRTYLDKGVVANGPGFVDGRPVAVEDIWQEPAMSYGLGASLQLTERQVVTGRWALSTQAADSDAISTTGERVEDCRENRLELGYRVDVCARAVVTLTAFYSAIDNGLLYDGPVKIDGRQYPSWRNSDLEKFGLELVLTGQLTRDVSYFTNVTWMNGTVDNPGSGEEHDDRLPPWLLSGGLRYRHGPWSAAVSLKYTYEFADDFGTRPKRYWDLGDCWLLDMNVAYVFYRGKRFEHALYCGMRNALNEQYQLSPGFDNPGRDMYVGYTVKW